jgi:elongation factor Ts
MAEITAKMALELRDRTGAGMMDCKKALIEADGDMDKANDILRAKGLAKAAAKADRAANEGLIKIHKDDERNGSMIILHCETDFVAATDDFKALIDQLAAFAVSSKITPGSALRGTELDVVRELDFKGRSVHETITETVGKVGENVQLGAVVVERSNDANDYLAEYLHGKRVGVLVCLTTGKPETHKDPRFLEAAKDLCFQVAAGVPSVPIAADRDSVDAAAVAKERAFLIEQAKGEGKSQEIAEKMVEGRLGKFFSEVVLLEQPFIKDDKAKVSDYLKGVEKEIGDTIKVARFHRFQLGD